MHLTTTERMTGQESGPGTPSSIGHRDLKYFSSTFPNLRRGKMHTYLYLSVVLLTWASDIEVNPGPRTPKYPCQICHKAVTWSQKGVACDDCNQWYHADCMSMPSLVYNTLNNVSWHCVQCGKPQFTSSFFDSISTHTNSFSALDSSVDSFGPPEASSSPNATQPGMRRSSLQGVRSWNDFVVLNINFQSIRNKRAELLNIIDSYNPSVMIGSETWLNNSIHSSEFFQVNYGVHRKDRNDGYGRVLIAVRSDIICDRLEVGDTSESVYVSIRLDKNLELIIGSLYRPPSSSLDYLVNMCETLEAISVKYRKAVLWIGGDLNLPDIDWSSQTINGNACSAATNKRFLECVNYCALDQIVDFPTRNTSTLDLFLTNRPSLVIKCAAIP